MYSVFGRRLIAQFLPVLMTSVTGLFKYFRIDTGIKGAQRCKWASQSIVQCEYVYTYGMFVLPFACESAIASHDSKGAVSTAMCRIVVVPIFITEKV